MDADGRLHAYDRRSPDRGVFHTPPHKVFFQKDIYTAIMSDGTKDVSLEFAFGKLESAANALFQRIIAQAREGRLARLTPEERNLLDGFTYFQWKRVPESIDRAVGRADLVRLRDEAVEQFVREVRPLTPDEEAFLASPAGWKRVIQFARRNVMATGSPEVMDAFGRLTFNVAHITNPRRAFIVSSAMVCKLNAPNDKRLNAPTTEIWMPLASDVAVAYSGSGRSVYLPLARPEHIRHINEAAAWGSSLIASRSPELTRSLQPLVGLRMDRIGL